jgi:hypothetical protein
VDLELYNKMSEEEDLNERRRVDLELYNKMSEEEWV